jgi:hypothetical protein
MDTGLLVGRLERAACGRKLTENRQTVTKVTSLVMLRRVNPGAGEPQPADSPSSTITASISTCAPRGSEATPMVTRAG